MCRHQRTNTQRSSVTRVSCLLGVNRVLLVCGKESHEPTNSVTLRLVVVHLIAQGREDKIFRLISNSLPPLKGTFRKIL